MDPVQKAVFCSDLPHVAPGLDTVYIGVAYESVLHYPMIANNSVKLETFCSEKHTS